MNKKKTHIYRTTGCPYGSYKVMLNMASRSGRECCDSIYEISLYAFGYKKDFYETISSPILFEKDVIHSLKAFRLNKNG